VVHLQQRQLQLQLHQAGCPHDNSTSGRQRCRRVTLSTSIGFGFGLGFLGFLASAAEVKNTTKIKKLFSDRINNATVPAATACWPWLHNLMGHANCSRRLQLTQIRFFRLACFLFSPFCPISHTQDFLFYAHTHLAKCVSGGYTGTLCILASVAKHFFIFCDTN